MRRSKPHTRAEFRHAAKVTPTSTEPSLLDIPLPYHNECVIESTLTEHAHSMLEVLSKPQFKTRVANGSSSEVNYNGDYNHHTTDHVNNPIGDTSNVHDSNTIPYPYSPYNDEADVEAHVRAFLTIWMANHIPNAQRTLMEMRQR